MGETAKRLMEVPEIRAHALGPRLLTILERPVGLSSAGFPFLQRMAWEQFRDRIPHTLRMGLEVLRLVERIEAALENEPRPDADNIRRGCRVVRQVVLTATITAPPNLWLLKHVLRAFARLGLIARLLAGDALYPNSCTVVVDGRQCSLDGAELAADLHFLLSLGVVEQYEDSFRVAGHPRVRRVLESSTPLVVTGDLCRAWRRVFAGGTLDTGEQEMLLDLSAATVCRVDYAQNHWFPTTDELELGYRLVPVVLAMHSAQKTANLVEGSEIHPSHLGSAYPRCAAAALETLTQAGWMERDGERYRVTVIGARGFSRGPGPFGIIQAYSPYMTRADEILLSGRGPMWVQRGENIGASQVANRTSFKRANASLDQFCADTGFELRVFIEHAIGRGEATRQRYGLSGADGIAYIGADLEDAAIDAALLEQQAGHLPPRMKFIRNADIGSPQALLQALDALGIDPRGAVMMVGNGFHEIREQTDERVIEALVAYHRAGILLLFTEENALSIDDLRATAWNTYHAGFKYVHEKSGQALRPAEPRASARLGRPMRAAWSECAAAAGYVRADAYCTRTRTVYPYTPPSGINPSISVNHFFVPAAIAAELGLSSAPAAQARGAESAP